jgi:hypothetical protein
MDQSAQSAPGLTAELKDCHHTIKERIMPSSRRRKEKPRPVPETPTLTKEQGVWVLNTGDPLPASATDEVLQRSRKKRDMANVGKAKKRI